LKEWVARLGLTVLFVALVVSFALDVMWPPSRLWVPVLLLIPATALGVGKLWLRYFEEQAIQREIRERAKKVDKPARPQTDRPDRVVPLDGEVEPKRAEPAPWPPPPDQQSF
jgi:hypothetical protein